MPPPRNSRHRARPNRLTSAARSALHTATRRHPLKGAGAGGGHRRHRETSLTSLFFSSLLVPRIARARPLLSRARPLPSLALAPCRPGGGVGARCAARSHRLRSSFRVDDARARFASSSPSSSPSSPPRRTRAATHLEQPGNQGADQAGGLARGVASAADPQAHGRGKVLPAGESSSIFHPSSVLSLVLLLESSPRASSVLSLVLSFFFLSRRRALLLFFLSFFFLSHRRALLLLFLSFFFDSRTRPSGGVAS